MLKQIKEFVFMPFSLYVINKLFSVKGYAINKLSSMNRVSSNLLGYLLYNVSVENRDSDCFCCLATFLERLLEPFL